VRFRITGLLLVILLLLVMAFTPSGGLKQLAEDVLSTSGESSSYTGDPLLKFLGRDFREIKDNMGEPVQEGYSSWYGPHHYLLYSKDDGNIRFCSPEGARPREAVSLIAGRGVEVLGVRVGMTFTEIEQLLGQPDYGPEPRSDKLYYIDYFLFDGQLYVSFSAGAPDGPTSDVFIKKQQIQ